MSYTRLAFGVLGPQSVIEEGSNARTFPMGQVAEASSPTYNDTIVETVSSADTNTSVLNSTNTVTEAASAADTVAAIGSLIVSINETASAVDTVIALGDFAVTVAETTTTLEAINVVVDFAVAILEEALASTVQNGGGAFTATIAETTTATDEISARRFTATWFLSFTQVTPPPSGEGPGNPGKLFGDYHLKEVP